ncbi:MAG: acyl-CoA dehydrogenase family protein [Gammaproteobacteria bacterium]|jgi:alkylation response protein AidB-like acyl-CoA dehydrogenase|nr:acyl-CoA dehydrogenase family protein [Gammaproteobacteria bacterium]
MNAVLETPTLESPDTGLLLDTSAVKSLFLGHMVQQNLFPYPKIREEERETLEMVLDSFDRFLAERKDSFAKWDDAAAQPEEFLQGLRDMGLFGLIIPEEYEGLGLSNAAYSRVLSQSSRHDSSSSLTIGAHSSIGMKGLLLFGTDEQKAQYLPRLASGEMIAAFCLTEAGAGSDAAALKTRAVRNDDGTWTLNGEKIWVTNGGLADFFTVFARTEGEAGKLSAFIVEKSWPGVAVGPTEHKMGIRASSTTTVSFADVILPAGALLGPEGKGFKVAMEVLNNGRTGLGGGAVGGMKACIELSSQYAKQRKAFGQNLSDFGLIKKKIARMTVDCFAAESVVWMVAHYIDSGHTDYSTEAAISKVFASEAMLRTANEAMQIAAGNGYMKEYPYERIVRDSRILTIFEGTSEILRLFIALSGMKDVGDSLKDMKAGVQGIFNNPIKGFGVLTDYTGRRLTQITSLGRDRIVANVPDSLQDEALVYEKYTLELARLTDVLLRRHGKHIIGKQLSMQRVADVAIDLFVGISVLSRVASMQADGSEKYEFAVTIAKLFTQDAKRRMNQNLRRLLKNEDEGTTSLCDYIVNEEAYPWDII